MLINTSLLKISLFKWLPTMERGDLNALKIVHKTLYTTTWRSIGPSYLRINRVTSEHVLLSGAPNENIVQNHLNIAVLNVF